MRSVWQQATVIEAAGSFSWPFVIHLCGRGYHEAAHWAATKWCRAYTPTRTDVTCATSPARSPARDAGCNGKARGYTQAHVPGKHPAAARRTGRNAVSSAGET